MSFASSDQIRRDFDGLNVRPGISSSSQFGLLCQDTRVGSKDAWRDKTGIFTISLIKNQLSKPQFFPTLIFLSAGSQSRQNHWRGEVEDINISIYQFKLYIELSFNAKNLRRFLSRLLVIFLLVRPHSEVCLHHG